jgi:hypothetical protein
MSLSISPMSLPWSFFTFIPTSLLASTALAWGAQAGRAGLASVDGRVCAEAVKASARLRTDAVRTAGCSSRD